MKIRRAEEKDIPKMMDLLLQVCLVHHRGRPDLFGVGTKYDESEILALLSDETRPILVAVDEADTVWGYAFCVFQHPEGNRVLNDVKTLYIDDLCVDENARGQGIGKLLYHAALSLAKELDCYNLTLNVWSCNESALRFYESCGLVPQKIGMEILL
jgi:ribosomal protein S18 acetylase RimI-like enzyme